MKSRGLLFNPPMARATLADLKTHTRRTNGLENANAMPSMFDAPPKMVTLNDGRLFAEFRFEEPGLTRQVRYQCPYGRPGDQLWGRETFYAFGRWETRFSAKKGRDEWHFIDMTLEAGKAYAFEEPCGFHQDKRMRWGALPKWHRRPSLFMPRVAARILLEITDIRVERLQDISEADCIAEGAPGGQGSIPGYPYHATPHEHYRHIWEAINGDGSWAMDPWVWVITFKRLISPTP